MTIKITAQKLDGQVFAYFLTDTNKPLVEVGEKQKFKKGGILLTIAEPESKRKDYIGNFKSYCDVIQFLCNMKLRLISSMIEE